MEIRETDWINIDKINQRKSIQYIDNYLINTKEGFIVAVYKTAGKLKCEPFPGRTLKEIKEVIDHFNRTLREGEKKRILVRCYKVIPAIKLEKVTTDE